MKKIVLLLVSVILLIAVPVTVLFVKQRQDVRKRAAPATTLTLSPSTITKKVDETFSLEATIDTGENNVVSVALHLVFDPAKLEAQTITNGPLFPSILTSGTVDRGVASITVGASDSKKPVNGSGSVAVVKFKALERTDVPVAVRFAANTFVGGLDEATNVLVGSSPASVNITSDESSAQSTLGSSPLATSSAQKQAGSELSLEKDQKATTSAEATSSAVQITSPSESESVDDTPTLKGKAPPGATVTITIYSEPITIVVTADTNGNWVYTPTQPLEPGPHNIVVTSLDPKTQQTGTTEATIVVAGGGQESATQSAIPIAGTMWVTYTLLLVGSLLFLSGLVVPLVTR